jgi:hypothetical protein
LTTAGVFAPFGNAGPTFVSAAQIRPPGPFANDDTIIVCDLVGRVASIEADTGALNWQSVEVASGASAAPTFVFLEAYRTTSGTPQQNVPCVLIPSNAGSIVGVMINGQTNSIGERRVYQYNMTGGPASPIAVGGWRPSDTYCWFYAGDASGQFFAFNGDDPSFITPGRVPGTRDFTEDDPGSSDLSNIFSSNRILLVSPESHKDLATKLRDGTLTRADLLDAAANESIARRIFDFGETLYILAYDLPAARGPGAPGQGVGGPPTPDYRAEVVITIGGRQIRRQVPVNDIPTMPPGANSRFVLTGQPLLPTGRRGLRPGLATVALRARAVGNVSVSSALVPLGPVATNGEIRIANPLALFFNEVGHVPASGAWNSVGDSTDATLPINLVNGSPGIDAGGQAGPNKESTNVVLPGAYFGPNFNLNGDDVAHGSTGGLRVTVRDRSLMFMVLNRGLQNVKLESDDYSWQVRNISNGTITDRNMWKPLSANTGASYPGFEDLPTLEPNLSIDYPDIDGSRLSAAKSSFGRVQNPIFSGVGLNMPLVTAADKTTYFTRAGFEVQMIRTLQSTFFDLTVDVPRYQPASGPTYAPSASRPGYRGHAQVYVEAGSTGFSAGQDTYRTFANAIRIGADERLSIGTPTVDLGSMPSGAGFDGGPPAGLPGVRGPIAPWDPTSSFRPYNSAHDNMFDDFVVYNEGNVNLLNVRVAKAFDRTTGLGINRIFRPVELLAPSLHDLSWLDGPLHMFSSLDPLYSNTGRASQDPEARNILQKPRPGDAAPTRLSTNPVRRPNVNLGVTGGTLLNAVTYPPGDPRIGVSTPLGAPSGEFLRRIWVFEDSLGSNGATPETPSLGPRQTGGALDPNDTEAYSDPPMNLKFTVREARMTNRPTTKAAPNVDTLVVGNEDHYWQNRQPTALRTGAGSMLTAFASNRLNAANLPGFGARTKLEADEANLDTWRIYLTGLGGSVPNSSVGQSPIRDLNNFIAGSASRWQTPLAIVPAAGSPLSLFSVPNHTMVPGSADFHSPSFAAAGSHDPLSGGTGTRPSQSTRYLAYLGEAEAVDGQGTRKSVSQIMISNVDLSTGAIGGEFGVPYDEFGFKSRPSITQQGGLATVMYTTYTSAAGQINWTTFNGSGFTTPRSLPMGRAFDWVGAPSTVLRRYRNSDAEGSLETTFAARRRGRSLSETMMARLATGADGLPIAVPGQTWDSEFGAMRPFGPRIDELQLDTTTGAYWAPGMMWRLSPSDLDFVASPTSIQILDGSGTNMIAPATAQVSADGRTISGMTPFGGTVSLDTITGSVRFDGAVIPRSARIFVRYAPFYISVMSGGSSNTRSASSAFDDRLLGIYVHPTDSQRTKLTDLSYWARESGAPAQPTDPIRWDRTFVASTRTSNDGSQSARPSFKTLRFGVQLPTPIAVDAAGIAQLSINWTSGIGGSDLVPAFERFYQVDPANGRVYLMSGAEDRLINITYTQADTTGAVVGGSVTRQERVVLVEETAERTVPIEQATNESDLRIFLDPSSIDFNGPSVETRRPGLVWLFWTSTRSGGSDVYFQTLAPRFSVIPPG